MFHLGNLFMILTGLRLNKYSFMKYKLNCGKLKIFFENTLKIALKSSKSPYFSTFWEKILGLRKSFLNQTSYVLKNR